MAEITDRKSLEAWLATRPPEHATLIAARAALRVLPALDNALQKNAQNMRVAVLLPAMRAMGVASFVYREPEQALFRASARLAAKAAAHAARTGNRVGAAVGASAAAYATIAAADAASAYAADVPRLATREAARAAGAAGEAVSVLGDRLGQTIMAEWQLRNALSQDTAALEHGHALGQSAIWYSGPAGIPILLSECWESLKQHLLFVKEGWQVWTDWYDAILEGRPLDPVLELKKALIPERVWQQGPSLVNAEIARLIAEHEVQTPAHASDPHATDKNFHELLTDTIDAVRGLPEPQIVLPPEFKKSVGQSSATEFLPTTVSIPPNADVAISAALFNDSFASSAPAAAAPRSAGGGIPTVAFFSYTRSDDRHTRGVISAIRKELQDAVSLYHGSPLDVFQDKEDIEGGQIWRERLERALADATIFVPLITPAFFNSVHCREELSRFLARGGTGTLVLPIHFIDTDFAASEARDELRAAIEERQWFDWRPHQRQIRINKRLRDDIHKAARLILARWRAARPEP